MPRKATVQSAITRPCICGLLSNCKVTLPSEVKLIEKKPTITIAITAIVRVGEIAASRTEPPKRLEERANLRIVPRLRPAV